MSTTPTSSTARVDVQPAGDPQGPSSGSLAQLPVPGARVRVVQQMPQADQVWTQAVEGVITRYRQARTGSWFAHSRDDRLWLDRLELRLDDGELTVLNLDQYSVIEALSPPTAALPA